MKAVSSISVGLTIFLGLSLMPEETALWKKAGFALGVVVVGILNFLDGATRK